MINKHLASLALDEDSSFTNSCLFTIDCLCYCCYEETSSSAVQKRDSVRKTYRPLLVFYISLVFLILDTSLMIVSIELNIGEKNENAKQGIKVKYHRAH